MNKTRTAGWAALVSSLIAMVIGHTGEHRLSWTANHISTFAAQAPRDAWITASMLLFAATLLFIGILISRYHLLGTHYPAHVVSLLTGAAIAGLVLLAYFEETAMTMKALLQTDFAGIRQQSFHDAGLLVFFYSSLLLTILAGVICLLFRKGVSRKISGVVVTCLGPASFLLMTTSWPTLIGITAPASGLRQRVSLLCIWLAMALLLALASGKDDRTSDA